MTGKCKYNLLPGGLEREISDEEEEVGSGAPDSCSMGCLAKPWQFLY